MQQWMWSILVFSICFPIISLDEITVLSLSLSLSCLNIFVRHMLRSGRTSSKTRCTFNFDKYYQITFFKKGHWFVLHPEKSKPYRVETLISQTVHICFECGWSSCHVFLGPLGYSSAHSSRFLLGCLLFLLLVFKTLWRLNKEFDSWTMPHMLEILFS